MRTDTTAEPAISSQIRLRLAPELPALESLGVDSAEMLLDSDCPRTGARHEGLHHTAEVLLLPLPGTALEPGVPAAEAPRGAGTGWVTLERWHAVPLTQLLPLRFGSPRSASIAERHWNLLCHLRAHGVGTPEPLAVGARGNGLVSSDSFLVTRELGQKSLRLDKLIRGGPATAPSKDELTFAARSIALSLGAMAKSGVCLPLLDAGGLWLRFSSHSHTEEIATDDPGCGLSQLATWRADRALGGLQRDPRPAVLVSEMTGGFLSPRASSKEHAALLKRIEASLPRESKAMSERSRLMMDALRD